MYELMAEVIMEPDTTPETMMRLPVLLKQTLEERFRLGCCSRNCENIFVYGGCYARLEGRRGRDGT